MATSGFVSFENINKFQSPARNSDQLKCAEVFRDQHGNLLYVCFLCSKEFTKALDFEQHIIEHFDKFVSELNTSPNVKTDAAVDIAEQEFDFVEDFLLNETTEDSKSELKKEGQIVELEIMPHYRNTESSERFKKSEELEQSEIRCDVCEKAFPCCGLRDQHIRNDHDIVKPFYCKRCNAGFSSEHTFNRHKELHSILNLPVCMFCKRIFEFTSELNGHLNWNDRNRQPQILVQQATESLEDIAKPHICEICGKGFSQRSYCRAHMQRHSDENLMHCDICSFKSRGRTNLIVHMRIHSKERPYSCDVCGKTFTQSSYVKIHKRMHTGEKPYICTFCGMSYYSAGNLNLHVRTTHTKCPPKKHPCSLCDRRLRSPFQLKIHMRTHTGEKPYSCPTCGACFSSNKTLGQHKLIHSSEKHFVCKYCGMEFAQSAGRRGHEKRVHEQD